MTDQSGPEAAPASRFQSPAGDGAQLTLGIFGPRCEDSSPSAGRRSPSVNKSHPQKLSARSLKLLSLSRFRPATARGLIGSLTDLLAARVCITGEGGSMEYQQTLRNSVTPGGTPYVAHTASGRRISGRDCGGVQSGWPTPNSANADRGGFATEEGLRERMESGHQKNLQEVVGIAGWCTPNAMDGGQTSRGGDRIGEALLAGQAQAAGWATPQTMDVMESYNLKARKTKGGCVSLKDQMHIVTGAQPGSPAQTGPRGVLNPQFPLWLMGYPEAWATCAPGHQSWATVQEVLSETPDASAKEPCAAQATP